MDGINCITVRRIIGDHWYFLYLLCGNCNSGSCCIRIKNSHKYHFCSQMVILILFIVMFWPSGWMVIAPDRRSCVRVCHFKTSVYLSIKQGYHIYGLIYDPMRSLADPIPPKYGSSLVVKPSFLHNNKSGSICHGMRFHFILRSRKESTSKLRYKFRAMKILERYWSWREDVSRRVSWIREEGKPEPRYHP